MPSLTYSRLRRQMIRLAPTSRLGTFTVYLAAVDLFLYAILRALVAFAPGRAQNSSLRGWTIFLTIVLIGLGTVLFLRWFRHYAMWRLRNRLIVTYVFIGVIPVVLVVAMALAAGYLFAGQFATNLVTSDLQAEARSVQAVNSTVAGELASHLRTSGVVGPHELKAFDAADPRLSNTDVIAWYKGQPIEVHTSGEAKPRPTSPAWTKDFQGVVLDNDALYLRAMRTVDVGRERLTVISSTPLDASVLNRFAADLGEITIYISNVILGTSETPMLEVSEDAGNEKGPGALPARSPHERERRSKIPALEGGKLSEPVNAIDREVTFATPYPVVDWRTGKDAITALRVNTRPSLLYGRLFSRVGEFGRIVEAVLVAIAVFFAIIELLAFVIGVGITRTMTRSVAELYRATQHINRGDLKHRITVRSRDQLAALEGSFNSMSESLERLIAEQKEKERLQNELEIAQEVQAQLFPKASSDTETLEVHGVCRPARTVSGDYYDFLPLGPERLGIAVGDISGKGISAALLMATVHSAVRAYEFARAPVDAGQLVAAGSSSHGPTRSLEVPAHADDGFCPANVLSSLNRQLYRSTPAEKYATMFLGAYDGRSRILTYCNAGHLPPVLIGSDGMLRRLDTPGLVIGLFDHQGYEERNIEMHAGDMLVAFSDGVTEPENEYGEFGEHRLIEIVRDNRRLPLARISELAIAAVTDWIGPHEQPDDVTLVLARAR
jgi:sigma-B regulation protein RsbU (phosphoserine phosphatase)